MSTGHQSGPANHARGERFELLILSEAGKPIYSYTKREDAVTVMPLCSALMDYAQKTQNEALKSIKTSDNLIINFMPRSPLIFIVIHEVDSYVDPVILVDQVEAQVVSILTLKYLKNVFIERPTFDLKRLIYGSEKLIDAVTNLSAFVTKLDWPWVQTFLAVSSTPALMSNSGTNLNQPLPTRPHRVLVPVVSMVSGARESIQGIINNVVSSSSKNIVFSLLFRVLRSEENDERSNNSSSVEQTTSDQVQSDMRFKLMTVCNHHERHKIKIADIHIILALVTGSRVQLASAESLWLPVCLPRFNKDAFLHSYISCLNNTENCIVMMSIDRDEFTTCQSIRNIIEEKLEVHLKDAHQKSKVYYQMSPLVHPVLLDLQDKFMSNTLSNEELAEVQQQAKIYNSKIELYHARQLQFLWYQTNRQVLWWQRSASKKMNPTLFYMTRKMLNSSLKILWLKLADDSVFLGWHVATFQLYAQFDNTIIPSEATEVVQRITTWIKKEEENFSIKDYK